VVVANLSIYVLSALPLMSMLTSYSVIMLAACFDKKHREVNFTFRPTHCDPLICSIGDFTDLLHIAALSLAEDSTARPYTAALPAMSFCA
jgi:hypothetical protein